MKKNTGAGKAADLLIMATAKEILTLNIDTEEVEVIYNYEKPLKE